MAHSNLLMTYYGDDLTGSTDAMEGLTLNGVPTALFLEPPTLEQLSGRFENLRAVGVAGISRTMNPAQMDEALVPAFEALQRLGAPLCHYKVCSTFDSSPTVGSIGHATDIGHDVFSSDFTPMLVAAPSLGRHMAFGNLFATVGDTTYRLDRHPTMSRHPITPMAEADLRLHLAQQTDKTIGLIDLLHLAEGDAALDARLSALRADGAEIILFDTVSDEHLTRVGRLIWNRTGDQTLFVVGSSGVEYALTAWWQQTGEIEKPAPRPTPPAVAQLIVMSGSAAPVTAAQIEWAIGQGYAGLRLDTERLLDPATETETLEATVRQALNALGTGQSVVLYAALGPDDPAISATRAIAEKEGLDAAAAGSKLALLQGEILRRLLLETGLRRTCVTGGDSSGHAARQLGIVALEVLTPIAPGAPLCRATTNDPSLDGLQLALKGGQNGQVGYFESIRIGETD